MTTPPAQPPGSDPSGWPQQPQHSPQGDTAQYGPPGGWPPPAQEHQYSPQGYPAYGAGQPQGYPGYHADPSAPFGYDPYGRPYSDKQKLIAGLLQILVGGFGVGRFYTGHTGIGIAQLAVTIVTCGIGALWGLVTAS